MKQLIYPLSGPVCVSKDERVFKDIMIVFYHYEEAVITIIMLTVTELAITVGHWTISE